MVPFAELVESRTEQKRVYSQCDTWWCGHGSLSWVGYQIPSVYLWSDGEECVQLLYANNMNGRCVCVYFSGRRKTLFLSQQFGLRLPELHPRLLYLWPLIICPTFSSTSSHFQGLLFCVVMGVSVPSFIIKLSMLMNQWKECMCQFHIIWGWVYLCN